MQVKEQVVERFKGDSTRSVEVSFDRIVPQDPVRDMPGTGSREIYKEIYEAFYLNKKQNSQYIFIKVLNKKR